MSKEVCGLKKDISIIGVPMALGQNRYGVDLGPEAIRYAGLSDKLKQLNYNIFDLGNIDIERPEKLEPITKGKLRHLEEIVEASSKLAQTVEREVELERFPLILGGDHSIAIGTLAGLHCHYENLGVIWFDAHGDVNTAETSPSGNIHGMPLAVSLGNGHPNLTEIMSKDAKVKPENVVLIGARDLDDGEKDLLKRLNIKVYTMNEVNRYGMAQVIEETINYLKERTDGVHLSFDLDALNPQEAPGVGTPVEGGVTFRESNLALQMLFEANLITSAEFVEVNPLLDQQNQTGKTAVALIGALLGESYI